MTPFQDIPEKQADRKQADGCQRQGEVTGRVVDYKSPRNFRAGGLGSVKRLDYGGGNTIESIYQNTE